MNLKKLLQQEKQHILVSPKSYFLLLLLSLTALFSCIIELSFLYLTHSDYPALEVAFLCSLTATILIFALLSLAKTDLLDTEIIKRDP